MVETRMMMLTLIHLAVEGLDCGGDDDSVDDEIVVMLVGDSGVGGILG